MESPSRKAWIVPAALLGVGYALVGIVFALPTTHARAWRLAAWVASAIAFAGHIAYERYRLRNPPVPSALHVALGAALGAFGLAVGANAHSLGAGSSERQRTLLLLALVLWPVIVSIPAFVAAFVASHVLVRLDTR